ncbi:hypothetical protein BO86DRAFT_433349 [Aspergillus japonicus CBS 114.51]|uniref:3'-5' exonuclease domain-containing protein n=1 Tax=Aspergillus japonicus CBS 114.51 TaxID=1448312 RepID=A0A8T8WYE6_ASPJA|nr:hypothetical protein BO86DRAFT_433349 [Aspergillus japonicus CBS 114.51]RAH80329.1 hypothetical protein BO86DRAFT_433349 [Aspergillus japonicus CBS 114.51]
MDSPPVTIVDTPEAVSKLMDDLLVKPTEHFQTYLVDVHTLGETAFSTPAADNATTLKTIFESPTRTKVFFDVRNDSDALKVLYNVVLEGVEDVQIMELGFRRWSGGGWLRGLRACVSDSTQLGLSAEEKNRWLENKWQMMRKFRSEGAAAENHDLGLTQRPLTPEAVAYSVGDVVLLPQLQREYMASLDDFWMWFVARETAARVKESQDEGYVPDGPHKALVPWSVLDFQERIEEYNLMIEDEYSTDDNDVDDDDDHEDDDHDGSEASDAEEGFLLFYLVSFG